MGVSAEFPAYRRAVLIIIVAISTLAVGQVLYAWSIGNRFLLKGGFDWIYDVILWSVALAIIGRGVRFEALAALGVAGVMLFAAGHTAYDLWDKIVTGRRPEVWAAGWAVSSAIALALLALGLMLRFRHSDNPLMAATWLSSRNDAISTTAFAAVGFGAWTHASQWPEILLDLFVIALGLQAVFAIIAKVRADGAAARQADGQGADGVASSTPTDSER